MSCCTVCMQCEVCQARPVQSPDIPSLEAGYKHAQAQDVWQKARACSAEDALHVRLPSSERFTGTAEG